MTALLLAALAAACPAAPAPEAGPAELAAQARAAVAALERGGPTDALGAEAAALAGAAQDPNVPRGKVRALAVRFAVRLERHCRLQAMRATGGATPDDRARLERILERPEFRSPRPAAFALGRWLARIWEDILELLGTAEAGRYAAGGRNVFFALLAAGIVVALHLVLRRRATRRRPRAPGRSAPATHRLPDPGESDSRAVAALQGGDATEAVRLAFLGLLGSLERSGRIPGGRALTNRELADWLAATSIAGASSTSTTTPAATSTPPSRPTSGSLALAFSDLARTFDRVIYGMAPLELSDAGRYLERSRAVSRLVAGGAE